MRHYSTIQQMVHSTILKNYAPISSNVKCTLDNTQHRSRTVARQCSCKSLVDIAIVHIREYVKHDLQFSHKNSAFQVHNNQRQSNKQTYSKQSEDLTMMLQLGTDRLTISLGDKI